eukprot:13554391-Heterocapsa_arctica.AAC.1
MDCSEGKEAGRSRSADHQEVGFQLQGPLLRAARLRQGLPGLRICGDDPLGGHGPRVLLSRVRSSPQPDTELPAQWGARRVH